MTKKIALAGAALLAAAAIVLQVGGSRDPAVATDRGVAAPPIPAAEGLAPLAPLPEPARAEAGAPPADSPQPTAPAPSSGRFIANVVLAATGESLPYGIVRALSPTHFAHDVIRDGRVELTLAPGPWEVVVLVKGFEPERRTAEIEPGLTADAGTIELSRGTGRIEGILQSPGMAPGTSRFVELRGDGRGPCELCSILGPETLVEEPEPQEPEPPIEHELPDPRCCGYAPDRSVVRVGDDGRFVFDHLATGTFFLRPLDDRPRLQPTRRIELKRGESRFVELLLDTPVWLSISLVDERGRPFAGAWSNDFEEKPARIVFALDIDGMPLTIDAGPDPADVRELLGPPPSLGADPRAALAASRGGSEEIWPEDVTPAIGIEHLPITGRSRVRQPLDRLVAEAITPGYDLLEISMSSQRPNQYSIFDLPATTVRLTASCGGFKATEVTLDLTDPTQRQTELRFSR